MTSAKTGGGAASGETFYFVYVQGYRDGRKTN